MYSEGPCELQLCTHILSIDRNKSPLQISGKVAGCVVRTLKTFQGTHILGASRGLLCDSSAVLYCIGILVWSIPLPDGIDTGIGNTFWAQKYSILFSNTFAEIQTVEQLKRAVEIEHRSKETQQDCPTAFARESHQDQTRVTAATPPKKILCPHNIEKKRPYIHDVDRMTPLLRWGHLKFRSSVARSSI